MAVQSVRLITQGVVSSLTITPDVANGGLWFHIAGKGEPATHWCDLEQFGQLIEQLYPFAPTVIEDAVDRANAKTERDKSLPHSIDIEPRPR